MLSLVYVSSATASFTPRELHEMLQRSRERNALNSITGLLLYREGSFIQVLEGPDEAVWSTYRRIVHDPRHDGLLRLLELQIEQRCFPEWEMGFPDLQDFEVNAKPGYSSFLDEVFDRDAYLGNPGKCMLLLKSFRRTTQ